MLELVEVDVCAVDDPPSELTELDVLVEVCELAFPEPEPLLVELVDEFVEVDACEDGEPDSEPVVPPADVDEVDPVDACEFEPPLPAWLPVDVVVPV